MQCFHGEVHERGIDPPPFLARVRKRYCALMGDFARQVMARW
jgi:hypothetical protein